MQKSPTPKAVTEKDDVSSSQQLFRSKNVGKNAVKILNIGKIGKSPIEVIYAKYSIMYYYLLENSNFESKNGSDACNIMVIRSGCHEADGRLMLDAGYSKRSSECFYKSSRHAARINDFFQKEIKDNVGTATIWDKPYSKKTSGHMVFNYNCGIDTPAEKEYLDKLKNKNGTKMNYLAIESSAQPNLVGMKTIRESKRTMLFHEDIDNFKKWISDVCNYQNEIKTEMKKASSLGSLIKNCAIILEKEKIADQVNKNPAQNDDDVNSDNDNDENDSDEDDEISENDMSDNEPENINENLSEDGGNIPINENENEYHSDLLNCNKISSANVIDSDDAESDNDIDSSSNEISKIGSGSNINKNKSKNKNGEKYEKNKQKMREQMRAEILAEMTLPKKRKITSE